MNDFYASNKVEGFRVMVQYMGIFTQAFSSSKFQEAYDWTAVVYKIPDHDAKSDQLSMERWCPRPRCWELGHRRQMPSIDILFSQSIRNSYCQRNTRAQSDPRDQRSHKWKP